jgi:alkanesulfonate monooxygenase SsuD/methylene tetrahydromethanopterin reductase-like flavin-dependent oxidoreductase (luciferase family)
MWRETIEQVANMMAMDPYPGFEGKYFSMPCRNVIPKPVQKPHPPMWVACSNRETIHLAARLGLGALTFAFVDPSEARKWVGEYYDILKRECVPVGHTVNANVAMVTGFSCHENEAEARRRGEDGFRFFGFGLGHHYIFGSHKPGRTDVWANFEKARDVLPEAGASRGIGTPDQLRAHLKSFQEAGVDQVIFIQQSGRNRHEHICESLELFAERVLPDFKADAEKRLAAKERELAPYLEKALARKTWMRPLADDEIPELHALGRQIAQQLPEFKDTATQGSGASGFTVPLTDPLADR